MKIFTGITLIAIVFLAFSCKKEGTGGRIALHLKVRSGLNKVMDTVYLNYGEAASSGTYDQVKYTDSLGEAYFTNLKGGDYGLSVNTFDSLQNKVVGLDTLITIPTDVEGEYRITLRLK